MKKMKAAIIGGGRIGGAVATGLAKCEGVRVKVSVAHEESLSRFKDIPGISASTDNAETIAGADMIFLAVKPYLMESVIKEIAPSIDFDSQIIVSVAPGVKPEILRECLPSNARLAYAIPNTAVEFGCSMTFIYGVNATENDITLLKTIFDKVGKCMVVEDWKMLVAGTSLASCGIAYALKYIDASAEGGCALGFTPEESLEAVRQTVGGALAVLEGHGSLPQREIDRVTTPGGMTLRGLEAMERAGFAEAVKKGLHE